MNQIKINNEIYGGNTLSIELTQLEYDELSSRGEVNPEVVYYIIDGVVETGASTAKKVKYNNEVSLLEADNVQDAIDVLNTNVFDELSKTYSKILELESNFTMAADAIGNALVAKEIEVPEGASLLEMADIISNSSELDPKVTIYYQVDQGTHYSEKIKKGEPILYPSSFTPAKDGYTFVGWRKDNTASATVLSNEVASSSITLFAVFKKAITISFNGNGNSSGSTSALTGYIYYNSGNTVNPSFTLPSPGFAKTNYRFTKWALSGVNGTQYATGASVTHSTNATYYALWEIQKQTGTVECTRGYSVTVNFPIVFSTTPTVTFTEDINYATAYVASVSKSGVTFGTTKQEGTSFNWKGNIYWTAYI